MEFHELETLGASTRRERATGLQGLSLAVGTNGDEASQPAWLYLAAIPQVVGFAADLGVCELPTANIANPSLH